MKKKPVVIGSGIGGLIVSAGLSRAGIHHTLIASPPIEHRLPRLGESLNTHGTLGFVRYFPELKQCFYPKSKIGINFQTHKFLFDFGVLISDLSEDALPDKMPPYLLHVDIIAIEQEIYQTVINDLYCEVIVAKVESVFYDAESDRVQCLELDSGQQIAPAYVFDATNRTGVLRRHLNLPRTDLTEEKRLVFTYYEATADVKHEDWMHTTNLIQHRGKVAGFGWCIPLEKRVSVGIEVDNDTDAYSNEQIIDDYVQGLEQRGYCVRKHYPNRVSIVSGKNTSFYYKRYHGENWLLVGSTGTNGFFATSSGIGFNFAAAEFAPIIFENPRKGYALLDAYRETLLISHRNLMSVMCGAEEHTNLKSVGGQLRRMLHMDVKRFLLIDTKEPDPLISRIYRFLIWVGYQLNMVHFLTWEKITGKNKDR